MKRFTVLVLTAVLTFTTVVSASDKGGSSSKETEMESLGVETYIDQDEFLASVQNVFSVDVEELFEKPLDDELGPGHHLAQSMQYTLEYLDKYRNGKFEDPNFQKLTDLYFGSAQILASSDIFGEEDPMNYALIEYGMKSYLIAAGLMSDYFGLEIAESDMKQIKDIIDQIYEEYTLEETEKETDE